MKGFGFEGNHVTRDVWCMILDRHHDLRWEATSAPDSMKGMFAFTGSWNTERRRVLTAGFRWFSFVKFWKSTRQKWGSTSNIHFQSCETPLNPCASDINLGTQQVGTFVGHVTRFEDRHWGDWGETQVR